MKVLFVCSGNTCRSPMAEGYLNSKGIKNLSAVSAGFMSEGESVSQNSAAVMKDIGIDISKHKSRVITNELLSAEKIFCMSKAHYDALVSLGLESKKVCVLGDGVPDPFGQDTKVYRACRDEIMNAIDRLLYAGKILPIEIKQATKKDIKDIASLEKQCFSAPWSENAVMESMEHNTVFFKALYQNKFAGYIGVTAVADEGYISNIAVKKEFRENGIGSMLIDRAATFSRERRLSFLSLEVRVSNSAAISVYENLGFTKAGNRKDFYESPKEDGLIMTRRFIYDNTEH